MVTREATSLAKASAKSSNNVLATHQLSMINTQTFSLQISGSWSTNLDIAVQFIKLYLDNDACWFVICIYREEEM